MELAAVMERYRFQSSVAESIGSNSKLAYLLTPNIWKDDHSVGLLGTLFIESEKEDSVTGWFSAFMPVRDGEDIKILWTPKQKFSVYALKNPKEGCLKCRMFSNIGYILGIQEDALSIEASNMYRHVTVESLVKTFQRNSGDILQRLTGKRGILF